MDTPERPTAAGPLDVPPPMAGELFRRRRRKVMAIFFAGLGAFILGDILPSALKLAWWPDWLGIAGMAGFVVSGLTATAVYLTGAGFRCPSCRSNLALLFMNGVYYSQRGIQFCPFCGCEFDATPISN